MIEAIRMAGWMPASMLAKKQVRPGDFWKLPWEYQRKVTPYPDEVKRDFISRMKKDWVNKLDVS